MKFSLLVLGAPHACQASVSAWQFARAAVADGHSMYRVFFYHEAVYQGLQAAVPAADEVAHSERWAQFARASACELLLCIGSAVRRGVLDRAEAKRHERACASLHPAFALAGLGQLIDAGLRSDRLITFGS